MNMDYKQRNRKLYDMIKQYQICVIPDVENYDKLPNFTIIETCLKDKRGKYKNKNQKRRSSVLDPSQMGNLKAQ